MILTKAQLKMIKQAALENWLSSSKKDEGDTHLAECWIRALMSVLAKDKMELYAFEKDHNTKCSPNNMLDPSGKVEL